MDAEKMLESTIFEFMDLRQLKLSKETYECLHYWGCKTIGCLLDMTPRQIQRIEGITNDRFVEIVRNLSLMGLVLENEDSEYPSQNRENVKKYPYPTNLFVAMNEIVPCIKIKDEYEDHILVGLTAALAALSVEEETLILLRYKYGESFSALGRTYDLTHEAVRQKIKKAIKKLMQPPYRNLVEYGIDGYIDMQAAEQAKEKVKIYLQDEYLRGYSDGVMAQKQIEELVRKQQEELVRKQQENIVFQGTDPSVLALTIDDLDLSVRTYNCLKRAGIITVADMLRLDEEKICKIRNLGLKCVDELARKLAQKGIHDSNWNLEKIRAFRDRMISV